MYIELLVTNKNEPSKVDGIHDCRQEKKIYNDISHHSSTPWSQHTKGSLAVCIEQDKSRIRGKIQWCFYLVRVRLHEKRSSGSYRSWNSFMTDSDCHEV